MFFTKRFGGIMEYKFEGIVGENAYIVLKGEISGTTREELSENFRNFFYENRDKKIRKLYMDISGIDYVDSIGIAILLKISREAKEIGAVIYFVKATSSVKKVFMMLGLCDVFNFYENEVI